jgi:hypothetical protein
MAVSVPGEKGRKDFFFEKKKQKTFVPTLGRPCARRRPRGVGRQGIKVFCFFSSEKKTFLPSSLA